VGRVDPGNRVLVGREAPEGGLGNRRDGSGARGAGGEAQVIGLWRTDGEAVEGQVEVADGGRPAKEEGGEVGESEGGDVVVAEGFAGDASPGEETDGLVQEDQVIVGETVRVGGVQMGAEELAKESGSQAAVRGRALDQQMAGGGGSQQAPSRVSPRWRRVSRTGSAGWARRSMGRVRVRPGLGPAGLGGGDAAVRLVRLLGRVVEEVGEVDDHVEGRRAGVIALLLDVAVDEDPLAAALGVPGNGFSLLVEGGDGDIGELVEEAPGLGGVGAATHDQVVWNWGSLARVPMRMTLL
jgi:hypothetical protein